jgi:hypothetical protein
LKMLTTSRPAALAVNSGLRKEGLAEPENTLAAGGDRSMFSIARAGRGILTRSNEALKWVTGVVDM